MRTAVLLCVAGVLGAVAPAALAQDDEMYKSKNCFACHRVDRNHLGPAFKAVGAKYADEAGADAKLAQKIREGSGGVWGELPMPPQPQVSEADAKKLAEYVLSVK